MDRDLKAPAVEKWIRNETPVLSEYGRSDGGIHLSRTASFLIRQVGRFCERQGSDFLDIWDKVRIAAVKPHKEPVRILFGIYEGGVDSNVFFYSRMAQMWKHYDRMSMTPERIYRRVYVLSLVWQEESCRADLYDITAVPVHRTDFQLCE